MKFETEAVPEALDHLRRIEGQLGGVIRMLERGRDCHNVIQQLAAVRRGIDRAGLRLLASQLRRCLSDQETALGEGYDQAKFERLFLMLS